MTMDALAADAMTTDAAAAIPGPRSDARDEAFGFVCTRCSRCCYDKGIQVNPYEIARLARRLGLHTAEFTARWTTGGQGTQLSRTEDGACVFLGSGGCTVHPDRPLVCRIYPLGRNITGDGVETFTRMEPHPQSEGRITADGTIRAYLEAQGAQDYIAAVDAYFRWVLAADAALDAPGGAGMSALAGLGLGEPGALLDMDTCLARYCAATNTAEPAAIDARTALHLVILHKALDCQEKDISDGWNER